MKRTILVAAMLTISACASTPPELIALPPAPAPESSIPSGGATILVREVTLPGYLDAFPVVVGHEGSALVVSKNTEWAERPSAGVGRVLRGALSQRLEASRVLIAGDGRVPDADLTVEFLALDPRHGALHLDARWFYSCTATEGSRGGRTQLDVPMAGTAPSAVAAATTDALTRFADVLAGAIPPECQPPAGGVANARR